MHRLSVALTALLLLSPPVFGEQKVTTGKGSIGVAIEGDHNTVVIHRDDPQVRRLLEIEEAKRKSDAFYQAQINRSQADADRERARAPSTGG